MGALSWPAPLGAPPAPSPSWHGWLLRGGALRRPPDAAAGSLALLRARARGRDGAVYLLLLTLVVGCLLTTNGCLSLSFDSVFVMSSVVIEAATVGCAPGWLHHPVSQAAIACLQVVVVRRAARGAR